MDFHFSIKLEGGAWIERSVRADSWERAQRIADLMTDATDPFRRMFHHDGRAQYAVEIIVTEDV